MVVDIYCILTTMLHILQHFNKICIFPRNVKFRHNIKRMHHCPNSLSPLSGIYCNIIMVGVAVLDMLQATVSSNIVQLIVSFNCLINAKPLADASTQCTAINVKLRVVHVPGMPGKFSRHWLKGKPLVSYPSMHHGTYMTAIWQEAHGLLVR